jgi:hypothetical protein
MAFPKAEWVLLVERSELIRDKLNLHGVIPGFWFSEFPATIQEIHFVARVNGTPGAKHRIMVTKDASLPGTLIVYPVDIELAHNGVALVEIVARGVRVNDPGMYTFDILADGNVIGHVNLSIEKRSAVPGAPGH